VVSRNAPGAFLLVALLAPLALPAAAQAQFMTGLRVERERAVAEGGLTTERIAEQVGFDQRLGAALPLEITLRDEDGREVMLGEYFAGKPVVLGLVYYRCPVLCQLIERGLASGLKPLDLEPGREFEVVFVSDRPDRHAPRRRAARKPRVLEHYGRPETAAGWHFLTGDEAAIAALAGAVGFRYVLDPSRPASTRTPPASPWRRRRPRCRAISSASISRRATSSSRWSNRRRDDRHPDRQGAARSASSYNAALGKYTAATMRILRIGATLTFSRSCSSSSSRCAASGATAGLPAGGVA
jgi:cytochrome oxidase Cu insertion factor (SCO1/SenC/PrrC family)